MDKIPFIWGVDGQNTCHVGCQWSILTYLSYGVLMGKIPVIQACWWMKYMSYGVSMINVNTPVIWGCWWAKYLSYGNVIKQPIYHIGFQGQHTCHIGVLMGKIPVMCGCQWSMLTHLSHGGVDGQNTCHMGMPLNNFSIILSVNGQNTFHVGCWWAKYLSCGVSLNTIPIILRCQWT